MTPCNNVPEGWRTNDEQIVIDRFNAEIERLKLALHNEKQYAADLITTLRCEADDYKTLITELADELEYWQESEGFDLKEKGLLERAREATK